MFETGVFGCQNDQITLKQVIHSPHPPHAHLQMNYPTLLHHLGSPPQPPTPTPDQLKKAKPLHKWQHVPLEELSHQSFFIASQCLSSISLSALAIRNEERTVNFLKLVFSA